MRRAITLMLVIVMAMSGLPGCTSSTEQSGGSSGVGASGSVNKVAAIQTEGLEFEALSDPDLQRYVADAVYSDLVQKIDSDEYYVENVQTTYVSKEYLEELSYNTRSNIYFGYTLADLEEAFGGERYVFTLGEDGQTAVKAFEDYDDTYDQVVRNIAVGTGVILVCVTVSAVAGAAGAPAASVIFAVSAKSGAVVALSSGAISGVSAAIFKGIETGDMDEALKAGASSGSEGFKWGAIGGALCGGAEKTLALRGATTGGLTMDQVATIQKESELPLDVLKQFNDMDQYEIIKNAGLTPKMVNGKTALIRDIDLTFTDEMGRTNLERMKEGLAALDPATGEPYELHHIGQQVDSTLAILTQEEHRLGGNSKIWHKLTKSDVHADGNNWDAQRKAFWEYMAQVLE